MARLLRPAAGMVLDLRKAAELCTQQELALVTSARPQALRAAAPTQLQANIVRARGLRNKFRDLAARQAREARRKAAPRGRRPAKGNLRTVAKAELFDEVLKRFEKQAEKLRPAEAIEPAPRRPTRTTARKIATARGRKRPGKVEPRTNAALRRKSAAAAGPRKAGQIDRSVAIRLHGHVGSRNRRNQSRRDAR